MDAPQRMGARRALRAIAEFYRDAENERRFQEWKAARESPEKTARAAEESAHVGA